MTVRKAERGDEKAILELILGLAKYENAEDSVEITADKLGSDLFDHKYCEALVAEEDSIIIGFALFYTSYSTWKGPCIYLEDLFVLDSKRTIGAGGALFDGVVAIAKERNCRRMDWQVLNWNELAIDFYKKRNAILDEEWINGRLFF